MRLVTAMLLCCSFAHASEGERLLRSVAKKQRTLASLVDADAGLVLSEDIGDEEGDRPRTRHLCGDALARALPTLEHGLVAELRRANYQAGDPGQEGEPTVSCDAHACSVWIDGASLSRMLYFAHTDAGLRLRGFAIDHYMSVAKVHASKSVERALGKTPSCP